MEASAASAGPVEPRRRTPLASPRLLRLASDERLVAHVRNGSQAAFEVIYDRHHRGILSFCRHMLGSREEAEDALQHTFMAAFRDMSGPVKDLQLRAWLYAIARNRCLSMLRARRERPSDDLGEPVTEGLSTQVQRRADLQDMLRDLAALAEDQRAALVLSELGDMSHDDIAAVLGCPRDKVKGLVFQARSSLQQSREARETSCQEIREMLSTLSGGALRRTPLRRHLKDCSGCRDFEAEVKRQRRAMAAVLPVLPTLGLKESALAATFGAKGAAAAATGAAAAGGVVGAGGTSALVAKALVVAAVASGGSVAGYQAVSDQAPPGGAAAGERSGGGSEGAGGSGPQTPVVPVAGDGEGEAREKSEPRHSNKARRRGKSDRGREWAKTRGEGLKRGLHGTQHGQEVKAERKAAREQRSAAREQARDERRSSRNTAPKSRRPRPTARANPRAQAPPPDRPERVVPDATPEPELTPEATPVPEVTPDAGQGRVKP